MNAPVRLALIGFGRWGRNYVKAAEDSGEAEVVLVIARPGGITNESPRNACTDLGAIDYCDGVVYAGHPRGAAEVVKRAMELDKPILCEKPAGLSLVDAERIAAAEAESKAFVLVGHQHLFAKQYEVIRSCGEADQAMANFSGPVQRDYPARWDYGSHAVACLLGLGVSPGPKGSFRAVVNEERSAKVAANYGNELLLYDGHAPQEPQLTRQVRAFAKAVRAGGTDDYRFGARWAVDVAKFLERAESADHST